MSKSIPPSLLDPCEGPACVLINPTGLSSVVLVCEHASNFIPTALDGLGLSKQDRVSHAAWDIGVADMATALSDLLDAPLVASRVSRLVHDCNRPACGPGAFPAKSEAIEVPGNENLSPQQKEQRARDVHAPFHKILAALLAARKGDTVLVTLHSFTPIYHGKQRSVELGLLHGADDRLALGMLTAAQETTQLQTELNAPYGPDDGVLFTLNEHALKAGLLNVMVEVRNDLLPDQPASAAMAQILARLLDQALPILGVSMAPAAPEKERDQ